MDYQGYDNYMRNSFGYPNMNYPNIYMDNQMPYQNMYQTNDDLERLYPDTYRVIYPMITSASNMLSFNTAITEDVIDKITDDIYDRAEADGRLMLENNMKIANVENENSKNNSEDVRQIIPRSRNKTLRDLIKILLLRELSIRRRRFPFRPF